jgi:outer membrane protein assembly factor BamA
MFSWLTGSGYFKQDEFDGDRDRLNDFYHSHGYLDFEIKDVKLDHPTTNTMVVKYYLYEGRQYKVGSVKFTGNKMFTDAEIIQGVQVPSTISKLQRQARPQRTADGCGRCFHAGWHDQGHGGGPGFLREQRLH